jgi:hypothetical protein
MYKGWRILTENRQNLALMRKQRGQLTNMRRENERPSKGRTALTVSRRTLQLKKFAHHPYG